MADFVLPDKRAVIELDDGDYAGAEISVSLRMPMAVVRELMAIQASKSEAVDQLDHIRDLFLEWGRPSWNLRDEQGAIPATREGMERLDLAEIQMIVGAWTKGVVEPPAPLPRPSSVPTPSRAGRKSSRRS